MENQTNDTVKIPKKTIKTIILILLIVISTLVTIYSGNTIYNEYQCTPSFECTFGMDCPDSISLYECKPTPDYVVIVGYTIIAIIPWIITIIFAVLTKKNKKENQDTAHNSA